MTTIYIYSCDLQPEAVQKGHDRPMLTFISQQIIDGSFLYTYDDEYRMKTKVVPNCAAYTYFYDDLDQLVMTEDGNGFKTFTKYDKLGRPIITGRYKGNSVPTRAGIVFEERSTTESHYYTTNQSFPNDGNIDIYTIIYEASDITNVNYPNYSYVRGLPTSSKVAILNNDGSTPSTYLNATTFYDQFRRVLHSRKENHLGGEDKVWSNYNFVGWLLQTKREHQTDIVGQVTTKTINERWEYDHIGRELICEKGYNERDEVVTKKIGNTTGNNLFGEGYTGLNNTEECCPDLAVYGARGVISGISADAAIPDPTDGAWPKWAVYAVGGAIATGILYYADDGADAVPINIPISKVQDNNKDPHYVYEIKGFSTPNEGVVTMKYGIGRINGSNFRPQTSLAEVQKRFPKYLLSWNIQMVTADKPSAIMGEKYLNGYHFTLYGSLPKASTYPGEKKSKKVFNQFKR